MRRRLAGLVGVLALIASLLASPVFAAPRGVLSGASGLAADPSPLPPKIRADLAALVAGEVELDPLIPPLVAGFQPGELPYFVVLAERPTVTHRAQLEAFGLRVLREYRSIDALAVASPPVGVLQAAALPWVRWLMPVEVVVALGGPEPYGDQTRGTPGDIGVPPLWDLGITGRGVRIAILDTGIDPTHPDLNDQDFRDWSSPLHDGKIVELRNFVGGGCLPVAGVQDLHGHGTHVAGIAAGTGSGIPGVAEDNGRYAGVAPDAELAIGKVLTDAGAGINSDLIAAMEWAATPASEAPLGCGVGAQVVNLSLGSESRPQRLNTGSDVDLVSLALNRLAVRYGTMFVVAAGNSGPFIGSQLESPGSASQALSVSATAKDYDLNHDDTYSGDVCAGYQHPSEPPRFEDNTCDQGPGEQPPSLSSLSSRGLPGDLWLRPDVAAPGYYIVSAQAAGPTPLASQDINRGTRFDPLYATASGTSMASPAAAGGAALLLQAYRDAHGTLPAGASGNASLSTAPAYALVRAALMNTAAGDLWEARLTSKNDLSTLDCTAPLDQIPFICLFVDAFEAGGTATVYEVRNGPADRYVGPLGEGAGKIRIAEAIRALREGVILYSAATGSGPGAGTGPRDLQGSWQVGVTEAGATRAQAFVLHAAPGVGPTFVAFSFLSGHPSDGTQPIPTSGPEAWTVHLPDETAVPAAGDALVTFELTVPADATPGIYSGVVQAATSQGARLRIPVLATVPLHDPEPAPENPPGTQARATLADAFAKADTVWPSALGSTGTGASSDWNVYPVELAPDLTRAVFRVIDIGFGNDTYDLYLYDSRFDLVASTHPGAGNGVTDLAANLARGPTPPAAPQVLTVATPAGGRHYLVVNRAKIGVIGPVAAAGTFGAFELTLDEVRIAQPVASTTLAYEGDFVWTGGQTARLAARLTDAAGTPIAGRLVRFMVDGTAPCPGGLCQAVTDYRGLAQLATEPIALAMGVYEVDVRFDGDLHWAASAGSALVLVVGPEPPIPGLSGHVTAGGWFIPDDASDERPSSRIHFAFHATGMPAATSGELRYRDPAGFDLTLLTYHGMVVDGDRVTLLGTAREAGGEVVTFALTVRDAGEPGKGRDTIYFRVAGYERSGTLGAGNIQLHAD